MNPTFHYIDVLLVLLFFISIIARSQKVRLFIKSLRFKSVDIQKIDQMDGVAFEDYLEYVFISKGFKVIKTKTSGDYGADLVLERKGIRTVVQAKRYSGNVSLSAVQEVVTAKKYYKATQAYVVTNSFFTKSASELASVNEVLLLDRNWILNNPAKEIVA